MKKLCSAVLYARLSEADRDGGAESCSIESQKEMLTAHAARMGWRVEGIYADDGWSGKNLHRPAFTEMLTAIREKKVDVLLTKDISRVSRNFIDFGRLSEFTLPEMGCRMVTLDDGSYYDETMMAMKSLCNDYYLKDLSKKSRAIKKMMASEGKRVSGRPPYGFKLDPGDRHNFIPDEFASKVVNRVFEMRANGIGLSIIAGTLNTEGLLSPREYEYDWRGMEWAFPTRSVWTVRTLTGLLRNEAYIGNRIQLRRSPASCMSQKILPNPKEEWVRAEGTHNPIISMELWEAVQEANARGTERCTMTKYEPALFRGILRCADCGGKFTVTHIYHERKCGIINNLTSYRCVRFLTSGRAVCTGHFIRETALMELLLRDILIHANAVAMDKDKVITGLERTILKGRKTDTGRISLKQAASRLADLERKRVKLYEDRVSGIITGETCAMLLRECEFDIAAAKTEHDRLTEAQRDSQAAAGNIREWVSMVERLGGITEIDRPLLEELVERIEVGEPRKVDGVKSQDIRIFYRFVGCLT